MKVYLDPRFEKQMLALPRAGKKGALAADKAQAVIDRLRGGTRTPAEIGSLTKHGEMRIRGVMKYDLGSGYRLITFRQEKDLFLLYVGNHDECHRWIENNRDLTVEQIKERCIRLHVKSDNPDDALQEENDEAVTDPEEVDPLLELTEKDLRCIFCGLVESVAAPTTYRR
jgi:hypothetical protein